LYRKKDNQTAIDDFLIPFGGYLLAANCWLVKAKMIPWDKIESDYADLFSSGTGNLAKTARLAFGALMIKKILGFTDEETVGRIRGNPYLHYFLGYKEFITEKPFDLSLMVFLRKHFGLKKLTEINETICKMQNRYDHDPPSAARGDPDRNSAGDTFQKKYEMLTDATCVPSDICLSGLSLGRPPKETGKVLKMLARQDETGGISIEDKFGKGKRQYGLSLIKKKLKQTSEVTIIISLIVMNLARGYRDLFVSYSKSILLSMRACFMNFARRDIFTVA